MDTLSRAGYVAAIYCGHYKIESLCRKLTTSLVVSRLKKEVVRHVAGQSVSYVRADIYELPPIRFSKNMMEASPIARGI